MTTLRRRPAFLTWGKARKLRKLRLDVGNEILLGMDDMQYHVDAKSLGCVHSQIILTLLCQLRHGYPRSKNEL